MLNYVYWVQLVEKPGGRNARGALKRLRKGRSHKRGRADASGIRKVGKVVEMRR